MDKKRLGNCIEIRRQQLIDGTDTSQRAQMLRAQAELTCALPVWIDMGGCLAVRSDLTVISVDDFTGGVTVETDEQKCNFALALAARTYPELAELRPVRTGQASDCHHCRGGLDYQQMMDRGLECVCAGLGWLPPSNG